MTQKTSWSAGTITSIVNSAIGAVTVQRDGQTASIPAVAQYPGYAVLDRVTLLLIGQQAYATGRIL